MGNITTSDWAGQALERLPKTLHSTVVATVRAMDLTRDEAGRPYIDHLGLAMSLYADKEDDEVVLAGLIRLVALGWIVYDGHRFTLGPTDAPISGGGTPRGQKTRHRTPISIKRRNTVFVRDNWTCWLCGQRAAVATVAGTCTDWDAVVDHVIPHSMGGSNGVENLRTAHSWCNFVRGARPAPVRAIQRLRVINRHATQSVDYDLGYSSFNPPDIFRGHWA